LGKKLAAVYGRRFFLFFQWPSLTLNGRIVLIYEVTLDQLDGQARLADTTTADDYQLVLSEKLRAS
jgi:hypothetical protein